MQETDRPLETSADYLNQAPGLNKEGVTNRCVSFAWLSQKFLSCLLVIDLQAPKFRTILAMKYRPAVWSRWPKLGVCNAIFKLRPLFSNRKLHDCCDSTLAAPSHLAGFIVLLRALLKIFIMMKIFNGRIGSDGQNRVCVTLVSHDATFVQ